MKSVSFLLAAAFILSAAFTSCEDQIDHDCKTCEECSPCNGEHCEDCEDCEVIYTVTFMSNGIAVKEELVAGGNKILSPKLAPRDGYLFDGWYMDEELENAWDFSVAVTANITLYAKWTHTYIITFNSNGGSEVAAQTIAEGEKAVELQPAPTREGYYFGGWFTDYPALTNKWDFDTDVVTANITLYAKWGTVKLLETWTNDYSYYTFEYDEQNRITKIMSRSYSGLYTNTLTYEGEDLVQDNTWEYTKIGNTITQKQKNGSRFYTIELNSDGLPVTCDENYSSSSHISIITYFGYQGGNLTDRWQLETYIDGNKDSDWDSYRYDNKKGALHDCITPKWYLILYLNNPGIKNNITHHSYKYNDEVYTCEFDDTGFPVKRTCKETFKGVREWEEVFTYITK